MLEQSKSARRRFYNGNFHNRYFSGNGVDIGGKPDPFSQYIGVFPLVKSMKIWDLEDGDAQEMLSCNDEQYDFVVSSHCLEHMHDVYEALHNWIRITKEGGYLIITVPDEDMYEQKEWPSKYNEDHKWTFTIQKGKSWSPKSINILDLLRKFQDEIEIEKIEKISEFYNYNLNGVDQTMQPNVESAVEFIIRKKSSSNIIEIQKNRTFLENEIIKNFPNQFSEIFNHINELSQQNAIYVIYGFGSMAQVLDKFIGDKIVGFVDRTSDTIGYEITKKIVYSPENLQHMKYDYIIVSVLGREKEIINKLVERYNVKREKIISLLVDKILYLKEKS